MTGRSFSEDAAAAAGDLELSEEGVDEVMNLCRQGLKWTFSLTSTLQIGY
jgi:hypothetical protein